MSIAGRTSLGGWRLVSTVVLVSIAGAFFVTLLSATGSGRLASDFHASYLDAARSVRENGTPYTSAAEFPYFYPPVLAELVVPLTFLPEHVASLLAFLGAVAGVLGALAVVGVRDVRCYAAVIVWTPGFNVLELANVTALMALLAALAWRYRDSVWVPAPAVGGAMSLKLFLWPLVVWMVATRRTGTAILSVLVATAVTLGSWAVIGFADFTSYPDRVGGFAFGRSYSFIGMVTALGLDPFFGRIVMAVAGGLLMIGVVRLGRRGEVAKSFTCGIVSVLALTPVVWLQYLVLLSVPLGIARPRFSAIWLVPIVLWVCPRDGHGVGLQPFLPALVVLVLLAALLAREGSPVPAGAPA